MEKNDSTAFMLEAIRLSHENMTAGKGGPFGCVVVKDGEIAIRPIRFRMRKNLLNKQCATAVVLLDEAGRREVCCRQ